MIEKDYMLEELENQKNGLDMLITMYNSVIELDDQIILTSHAFKDDGLKKIIKDKLDLNNKKLLNEIIPFFINK